MDATALLCNICPKRPKFSDVSHLLTHIASKAHLSHYFKLQVRSHQESQAGTLLDEYNHWYKANNLAKLLSDRLSSKDTRKKKSQGKPSAQGKNVYRGTKDAYKATTPLSSYNHHSTFSDCIDPRLADPFVSQGSRTGKKALLYPIKYSLTLTCNTMFFTEHTQLPVATANDRPTVSTLHQWKHENMPDSEDEGTSLMHTTPCWPRTFRTKAASKVQLSDRPFGYDPFVDDNDSPECPHSGEMDKVRADEMARLKGVLWPGMDIFDSATEQMKRKRNQKKDESILKMMERTSMRVEPTELVFSPTGVLRKQRVISGNVEDSSPLKGETPIPKKRATRSKRVLAQVDPNTRRVPEQKRARKGVKEGMYVYDDETGERGLHTPRGVLFHGQGPLGSRTSCGDDMDEFMLSFRNQDIKPRNKVAVFRDIPEVGEPKLDEHHHGVERLLSREPAISQSGLLRREMTASSGLFSPQMSTNFPSFFEKGPHVATDKENVEALLDVYGRLDPFAHWHSPVTKRHTNSDAGLQPHLLFGDAQCLGFNPFETHDSPTGYSFNPLSSSLSRMLTDENPIYASDTSRTLKAPSTTRANSPDATISEVEDDDFGRLYLDGSS
ncbi:hypothetical protein ARAM_003231 [Aspergillus rambellii]|uniref:Uncharacterized protein n=1 Tax=Aspergillus rambellii TaxID=308745 RepID=A0A0F8WIL1_9EURO|nr:hypothetical protein ARAM_003231 [Aspergillus rambellii]